MFIIMTGSISTGFKFYGPFNNKTAAEKYTINKQIPKWKMGIFALKDCRAALDYK